MPAETPHAEQSTGKWYTAFAAYEKPSLRRAVWQLINTFVPYLDSGA